MISSRTALRASIAATAALMMFPAAGLAATDSATSATDTTIGTELSVVAAGTTELKGPLDAGLTHADPAVGDTVVDVTSTSASWTLEATDAATTDKGHMTDGTTPLVDVLRAQVGAGLQTDLSDGVSVSGAMVDSKTFHFSQSLAPTEDVLAGDSYGLTVTYTVTDGV